MTIFFRKKSKTFSITQGMTVNILRNPGKIDPSSKYKEHQTGDTTTKTPEKEYAVSERQRYGAHTAIMNSLSTL